MQIAAADAACAIADTVFDQFFREMFRTGDIANTFSVQRPGISGTGALATPSFLLASDASNVPYGVLSVSGSVAVGGASLGSFDADVRLDFVLRKAPRLGTGSNTPGQNPVLGLAYGRVLAFSTTVPLMVAGDIDDAFRTGTFATALGKVALDVISPLVDAAVIAAAVFLPALPPRDAWPLALGRLAGDGATTRTALGVFLARPGRDPSPGSSPSFVPMRADFGIVLSRWVMDGLLSAGAAPTIGQVDAASGALVKRLTVSMAPDAVLVDGMADKDDSEINFRGPIYLNLIRGSTNFASDTRQLKVDVDLPWYADLLRFLTFSPLWPMLIGAFFTIERRVGRGIVTTKSSIGSMLANSLGGLATGLSKSVTSGKVRAAFTPDSSAIEGGDLGLFAVVMVSPITARIVSGVYGVPPIARRARKRFLEFSLDNGRTFAVPELARFMKLGLITIPGFVAVGARYIRGVSNAKTGDNLMTLFGPRRR